MDSCDSCHFCSYYKTTSIRFEEGICNKNNKKVKGYEHPCEYYKDRFLDNFAHKEDEHITIS